jgi:hypothetical protein
MGSTDLFLLLERIHAGIDPDVEVIAQLDDVIIGQVHMLPY